MSPPIYTPDGQEVTEIVLPDGSTASEVVAPDGSVVFEAGPDIPDSGVARWEFEQNLTDSWGNNDGSAVGNAQYTTTAQVGTYARGYDGVDDYDDFGDIAEVDGVTEFSAGFWTYPQSVGSNFRYIFGKGTDNTGWKLNLDDSGNIRAGVIGTSTAVGPTLTANTWYHIVLTYNSQSVTLYVNGSPEGNGTSSTLTTVPESVRSGGPDPGGFTYYDGIIDDARLYDKELTGTEVSNWYSTGSIS